jgi:hypothetical protein
VQEKPKKEGFFKRLFGSHEDKAKDKAMDKDGNKDKKREKKGLEKYSTARKSK